MVQPVPLESLRSEMMDEAVFSNSRSKPRQMRPQTEIIILEIADGKPGIQSPDPFNHLPFDQHTEPNDPPMRHAPTAPPFGHPLGKSFETLKRFRIIIDAFNALRSRDVIRPGPHYPDAVVLLGGFNQPPKPPRRDDRVIVQEKYEVSTGI